MTKRERFLAYSGFGEVDRVPRRATYVEAMKERMTSFLGGPPDDHFDMDTGRGAGLTAPDGFDVYNPAFDVTPARYVKAIITERGVISPVTTENVRLMLQG